MENNIITVSQLTQAISFTLQDKFTNVTVQGEISNFKAHSSGHRYFTLKDAGAQISCTMWKSRRLTMTPVDGMKVILKGRITVYPPRGSYQLDCTSITAMGTGDLFMAFEALKEKLGEAGYFDEEHKQPIPILPLQVGVATSPTGAAVRDIFSTLARRFPAAVIHFRPTIVQGEDSEHDIADAIKELNDSPAEVIIIGRGGGSLEDLWAFNTETVANAIFNSEKPIISAVGHETDFTISDFVADLRAATPTAAAELVTPKTSSELIGIIENTGDYISKSIMNNIDNLRQDIAQIESSYAFNRLPDILAQYKQRIDENESSLSKSIKVIFDSKKSRLKSSESHLQSLHPMSPLKKGFALLEDEGRYLNSKDKLQSGQKLKLLRQNDKADITIDKVASNVEK